jgi:pimeloyl-ACP methyl ester carboxylesterase
LIHGHLQAAEDWVGATYPELLATTHRVIAVDMLGYGESDKLRDVAEHTLDGRVCDLGAVLNAEEASDAVIWGYSLGVFTAEAFAKQFPERTVALVAGGSIVGLRPRGRERIVSDGAALLERSGLRAQVEMMPFLTPEAAKLFVRRNDALAAAAAARGSAMRHSAEDAALPPKTFNYVGTHEDWFDLAASFAEEKNITFAAVPGDHAQAFRHAHIVVPLVRDFLDRA